MIFTPIVITVLICTTLFLIFKDGIRINITKTHTYKDSTSYPEVGESAIDLKEKEPEEIKTFVEETVNTLNEYFEEDKK